MDFGRGLEQWNVKGDLMFVISSKRAYLGFSKLVHTRKHAPVVTSYLLLCNLSLLFSVKFKTVYYFLVADSL